jgi:hypothetical protein
VKEPSLLEGFFHVIAAVPHFLIATLKNLPEAKISLPLRSFEF